MPYTYSNSYVTASSLRLRSTANASSSILTTIPNATQLTVETCGVQNWFRTSYAGYSGYVSARYIYVMSGQYSAVVDGSGYLNLRELPSKQSTSIYKLYPGEDVTVLHERHTDSNGVVWYRVSHDAGGTGWVDSSYLYFG